MHVSLRALLSGLFSLLLIGALASCSGDSGGADGAVPDETTTTTVPPAVEPVHEPEAQERADGFALTVTDVPDGWVAMDDAVIDDVDDQVRICLGVDPGVGEIGRSASGFGYVDASGASRTISSMVRVYESEEAAATVAEAWEQEPLAGCLDQVFRREFGSAVEGETVAGEAEGLEGVPVLWMSYGPSESAVDVVLAVVHEGAEVALVRGVGLGSDVTRDDFVRAASAVQARLRDS